MSVLIMERHLILVVGLAASYARTSYATLTRQYHYLLATALTSSPSFDFAGRNWRLSADAA